MTSFPLGTPVLNLVSAVSNPATAQNPDGTVATAASDRSGALLTRQLGGAFYPAAARGNLFIASTLIAGVTVPAPGTTLASKAGLVNPAGSGKNMELVALGISSITIEVALKQFMLEFQINASQTGGAPTSVTRLTSYSMPLSTGNGAASGYAYTAATMTNAAANPILMPVAGNYETAVGWVPTWFRFNGEVVMGPDTVMAITNTSSILAINFAYVWAEWLV